MNDFDHLLREFESYPEAERNATFMEISGYPHYENVCSNILSFFLDPIQEHGFGSLFLKSIFEITNTNPSTEVRKISREAPTNNGGRLDILVDGVDFTIAIENKIFHTLKNDLNDYSLLVGQLNKDTQGWSE